MLQPDSKDWSFILAVIIYMDEILVFILSFQLYMSLCPGKAELPARVLPLDQPLRTHLWEPGGDSPKQCSIQLWERIQPRIGQQLPPSKIFKLFWVSQVISSSIFLTSLPCLMNLLKKSIRLHLNSNKFSTVLINWDNRSKQQLDTYTQQCLTQSSIL